MEQYNEILSFKIVENGYEIYRNGNLWITQYGQYSHPYKGDGSYRENCILQLEDLTRSDDQSV